MGREKLRLAKEIFEGLGKDGLKNLDEVERLLAKFETPNDIEKRREIIRREYSKQVTLLVIKNQPTNFFFFVRLYITIIGKDGKRESFFFG